MVKHTLKILWCEHGMIPKVYLTIFQHHVGKCLEINCLGKNWIQSFILYRDYVGSCFEKKSNLQFHITQQYSQLKVHVFKFSTYYW